MLRGVNKFLKLSTLNKASSMWEEKSNMFMNRANRGSHMSIPKIKK